MSPGIIKLTDRIKILQSELIEKDLIIHRLKEKMKEIKEIETPISTPTDSLDTTRNEEMMEEDFLNNLLNNLGEEIEVIKGESKNITNIKQKNEENNSKTITELPNLEGESKKEYTNEEVDNLTTKETKSHEDKIPNENIPPPPPPPPKTIPPPPPSFFVRERWFLCFFL